MSRHQAAVNPVAASSLREVFGRLFPKPQDSDQYALGRAVPNPTLPYSTFGCGNSHSTDQAPPGETAAERPHSDVLETLCQQEEILQVLEKTSRFHAGGKLLQRMDGVN